MSKCHEEFKKHWKDYPSQDNEGYLPDRGGFKAGWYDAWRYQEEEIEKLKDTLSEIKYDIEWLQMTLKDKRLPEEQAIKRRESRARGVCLTVLKRIEELSDE